MVRRQILILMATLTSAPTAYAQDLVPLREMNHDQIEQSYAFVRCAALHQANLMWAGEERIGADAAQYMAEQINMLLEVAISIRIADDGATTDVVTEITVRNTVNIAKIYVARFEENYARTGEAMASDPVWRDDLEWCKILGTSLE